MHPYWLHIKTYRQHKRFRASRTADRLRRILLRVLTILLVALLIVTVLLDGSGKLSFAETIEVDTPVFSVQLDTAKGGITSLKRRDDVVDTEYVRKGHVLGDMFIRYRLSDADWKTATLAEEHESRSVTAQSDAGFGFVYSLADGLNVEKKIVFEEDKLIWTVCLRNTTDHRMEIGDLALPLRTSTGYVSGDVMDQQAVKRTYQHRLNRHRFVAGHGSFIYWMRANGEGPCLVMIPAAGTKLEYFNRDHTAFIHSGYTGTAETRGTWRQEHTRTVLAPKDRPGSSATYGFEFFWGEDYDGIRDALYQNNSFDIHVVPGMTIPTDLYSMFSLRTKNNIRAVLPEYPDETEFEYLGERGRDTHVYKVRFSRLGENLLTIHYDDEQFLVLEFFCTEPLETVYKKRAAFITRRQQHRNDKWYNGLFSLWDMKEKVLRGPENTGGLQDYMVGGSDDPSNSKCVYLAEKNVAYPEAGEIEALEYFIENFVWGKHQRTDKEVPHPYGIYGSENWHLNRSTEWGSDDPRHIENLKKQWGVPTGTGLGKERMWRTYDYTTYIMLYFNMYLIARSNPDLVSYLDARGYLERAFGTSKAYFQVPYSIYMLGKPLWSHQGFSDWAYKRGNFHEKYIPEVIEALRDEGFTEKARWLKHEWEKKVKYFIYDDPWPFGSEFVFDRTAFESTHAISRYAIENPLQSDKNLWYDKNLKKWYSHPRVDPEDSYRFMERQIQANVAMRGWLETAYYYLGSARVGGSTLDYMSQMAGWSILDYALYYSKEPEKYARLGYASILSSWALVNSGTPDSNHGYWYPGPENDGAAGWSFQTRKYGRTWAAGSKGRGPSHYDGEIDHGLAGGLRAAATVVMDDPIFGRFAYGGNLTVEDEVNYVVPRDGVRRRLHLVNQQARFHLLLETDGFLKEDPVVIEEDLSRIRFRIENRSRRPHLLRFSLSGLPGGRYGVMVDDENIDTLEVKAGETTDCRCRLGDQASYRITVLRQQA